MLSRLPARGGALRRQMRIERLEPRRLLAADPIITELMASNDDALLDEDGRSSDWIEVYNAGDMAVDLAGWSLTDSAGNLDKWQFPSTVLAPEQYLVVFASGKDRAVSGSELHTSFELASGGEYLALARPDQSIAHEYAPQYPQQYADISYGLGGQADAAKLIDSGAEARVLVPADSSVDATWTGLGFDDASWAAGPTGVGYEATPPGYSALLQTSVPVGTRSAYVRIPFTVDDPQSVEGLTLQMKYDDGFVAYLNGTKVAEANAPANPQYNSTAAAQNDDTDAVVFEAFDISADADLLQAGENVLAIHGLNFSSASSDMLILPELAAVSQGVLDRSVERYFGQPSPGGPNGASPDDLGPVVWDVSSAPNLPQDDQDIVVEATVTEASSLVDSVTLVYRVMYGAEVSVPMTDDGTGYDQVAADGVFTAAIPHDASTPQQMVRWYVTAADTLGNPSRWPLFNDPVGSPEYFGTVVQEHPGPGPQPEGLITDISYSYTSGDIAGPGDEAATLTLLRDGFATTQADVEAAAGNPLAYYVNGNGGSLGNIIGDTPNGVPQPGLLFDLGDVHDLGRVDIYYAVFNGRTVSAPYQVDVSIDGGPVASYNPFNLGPNAGPYGDARLASIDLSGQSGQMIQMEFYNDGRTSPGGPPDASFGHWTALNEIRFFGSVPTNHSAYNSAVLADNPAYYWTFDEPGVVNALEQVNGLAADEFVPGANSVKVASTTTGSGVSLGQAAQIVGTGGYTWNVADLTGGGMAGAWAYEVWANADDITTYEYMVGSNAANGFNTETIFKWSPNPGVDPAGIQVYPGGGVIAAPAAPAMTPGWHHYVFVSDGATADYDAYVDGAFYGTVTSTVNHVPHPEVALKLGSWTDGASAETFDGLLDELAIYDLGGVADLRAAGQAIADHSVAPAAAAAAASISSATGDFPTFEWFLAPGTEGAAKTATGTRASLFYDGEFYDNIFVRVRGASSAGLAKNPFKFEFNPSYKFRYSDDAPRVDEFNLSTTYRDKAYLRQVLGFELYRDAGVPSSVAFPVQVHRNGNFFSVAVFVEHPDGDYRDRNELLDRDGTSYFATLNGLTLQAQGGYSDIYAGFSKRNPQDNDFSDIVAFVTGLEQTGLAQTNFVFDNMDIPGVLNYMAATVLLQHTDSAVTNYYVYRDTYGSGEWTMLPWDLDLTQGQRWLSDDTIYFNQDVNGPSHPFDGARGYPFASGHWNKLKDIVVTTPVLREMYVRRLRTLMDQFLKPSGTPYEDLYFENRIDELQPLMEEAVLLDKATWASWGQVQTFQQALDIIKNNYLEPRREHLYINHGADTNPTYPNKADIPAAQVGNPLIEITEIDYNPSSGNQDEEFIKLVNNDSSAVDISGWRLAGGVEHTFKPGTVIAAGGSLYVSPNVNAFRARSAGPTGGEGHFVQGDYSGHISNFGETIELVAPDDEIIDSLITPSDASVTQQFLRITELHYNPPGSDDATAFIELKNISTDTTLDLTDVRITDGPADPFDFTGSNVTSLAAGEFVLVVKDSAAFTAAYPTVNVSRIAGEFSGNLSNGGEIVKVEDATNSTVLEFQYEDGDDPGEEDWHPETDDAGFSLVIVDETGLPADWELGSGWRSSAMLGGSPAADDPVPAAGDANGDGIADGGDLQIWQQNFGSASGAHRLLGDLTGDRAVGGADFLLWQLGVGASVASASNSSSGQSAGEGADQPLAAALQTDFNSNSWIDTGDLSAGANSLGVMNADSPVLGVDQAFSTFGESWKPRRTYRRDSHDPVGETTDYLGLHPRTQTERNRTGGKETVWEDLDAVMESLETASFRFP